MATKVVLGANIKKETVRIDPQGNIINPATKQIIEAREPDYVPPPLPITPPEAIITPPTSVTPKSDLSILEQIEEAKKNLASLEELKKLKIEEKKKELELLQQ